MATSFTQFCARCKMRHDFSDQIQVRYQHTNGEDYDTWVSGEEVLGRLRSAAREQQLRGLSKLDRQQLQAARDRLPEEAQQYADRQARDWLGDQVEGWLGENVIGQSLADAVRGREGRVDPREAEKQQWQARLQDEAVRAVVLELAWIQLRGSFPEGDARPGEADDWV